MNSYILTTRIVKDDGTFGIERGIPSYLQIPDTDNTPHTTHKIVTSIRWMNSIIVDTEVLSAIDGRVDILFFVHGFNTSPEEALERQRMIQRRLSFYNVPIIVVGFDWPSADIVTGYLYDREEAHYAAHDLVSSLLIPFSSYTRPDCTINVHVLAHSMGGYVVREAFRTADKIRKPGMSDWRVNQLMLVAADVSSASFEEDNADMISIFRHCDRLTNYFNGYDQALSASNAKRIGLEPRVGRIGMPTDLRTTPKAIDVDCSARYERIVNNPYSLTELVHSHDWYFEDEIWSRDLMYNIIGTIDRNLFPSREKLNENDFTLKKA